MQITTYHKHTQLPHISRENQIKIEKRNLTRTESHIHIHIHL